MVQQELDFLLRDRLAVHADGQFRRDGRTDRRERVRGDLGVAQLGGGGHVFANDAVWQHHRIAGGCEGDRSSLEERFRLCAREVQDAAAQVAERRIDCGGLPERDESEACGRRGGERQLPWGVFGCGRREGEGEGGAVGGGDYERCAPGSQLAHQVARVFGIGPMQEARVAAQGGEPGVVHCLVLAGVAFQRRAPSAASESIKEKGER